MARNNFATTPHGFMRVNFNGTVNLLTLQKLASWACRNGKICRVMRLFCGALNRMIAGRLDPHC